MKKIVSATLIFVLLISSTLGMGSCSSKKSNELTIGQWLGMVNAAFGMSSYTQEKPYISSVGKDNEYFNTVQIAAEWDVIDANTKLDPTDTLTWKDALVTLVNVGNFTDEDATEDEKIQYAIEHFDDSIRKYWMNRDIDVADATLLLVTAQNQWVNHVYEEAVSEVAYADDVFDLSDVTQEDYKIYSDGVVTMDIALADGMAEGDVFVLPDAGDCATPKAFKVKEIKIENGVAKIVTDDNLELGDVVDELYVEETVVVDMDEVTIYGPDGNLLIAGTGNVAPQYYSVAEETAGVNLSYINGSTPRVMQVGAKFTASFEKDGFEVELTKTSTGISCKVSQKLSKEENAPKVYIESELSDVAVTNKIDYSWFKLHSAEAKVDYKTKTTIGVEKRLYSDEDYFAPKWTNGNGSFLTNAKRAILKDSTSKGAKTIKICSFEIASVGVASISLEVKLKINVDGSFEVVFSETGCKGVEYRGGNCRVINTSDKDRDAEFKCKAEGTLSLGFKVNAFGFAIIGANAEVGLGAEASLTMHLVDAGNHLLEETTTLELPPEMVENVKTEGLVADAEEIMKLAEEQGGKFYSEESTIYLHLDCCTDIKVYFILRVGLDAETLAGKLLKNAKVKISWEFLGSKNAVLWNLHVDNFDWSATKAEFLPEGDLCRFSYEPFDGMEEKQEELPENANANTDTGEVLMMSDMQVTVKKGSSKAISVVQVPNGYELKDIKCESQNKKIATIDKNGVIKGESEGSTMIIIKTSDGKYTSACAVIVIDEDETVFNPIL